jgi:hypothetical protein
MSTHNFTHRRGDTFNGATIQYSVNDSPVDITGCEILMQLKRGKEDSNAAFEFSTELENISIINAASGEFTLDETIIDVTPNVYFYDIQITFLDGTVKTILEGTFTITQDVSR